MEQDLGLRSGLFEAGRLAVDWVNQGENAVSERRKVRNESDIAEIEREGFAAFLPQTSPFEIIAATAAKYPDKPAIRYLTKVGAAEADLVLSYRDFTSQIRQAANLFHKLDDRFQESCHMGGIQLPFQAPIYAVEGLGTKE